MSRSGYSEDAEYLALWRANVDRAIAGKRGQAFLRELLDALDAISTKRLIVGEFVDGKDVCAIGAVGVRRGLDMSKLELGQNRDVAKAFGISHALACEVQYENDDQDGERYGKNAAGEYRRLPAPTPEERWATMRAWCVERIMTIGKERP